MKKQSVLIYFCGLIILLLVSTSAISQTKTKVTLTYGGDLISRKKIGDALSAIIQEANKIALGYGDLENVHQYCTNEGFKSLKDLLHATGIFTTVREFKRHLLITPDYQYEVRGIKVRVKMGKTKGSNLQELVFKLNDNRKVVNVNFAMEQHHYQNIIEQGKRLDDMFMRKMALDFLEEFRTAHNRKDINYLERAYSDDALIIVGRVLKQQKGLSDALETSFLGDDRIEFIKLKKKEYISRLRSVFQLNSFVNVTFIDAEVVKHPVHDKIYGIKVKQRWNSSRYNDEGYLFVMIDFRQDEKKPLIRVRSWQPEPFQDGTVVGLGHFEIIN